MVDAAEEQDVALNDVTDIADPLLKVKAGLQGSGGAEVKLCGVHIRAKLLDLAAQVYFSYCRTFPKHSQACQILNSFSSQTITDNQKIITALRWPTNQTKSRQMFKIS